MYFKIGKYLKNNLLEISNYYYQKGYYKKAESIFFIIYIFNLYDEKILLNFGKTLFRNGRINKAKNIFKKLVKLYLSSSEPFYYLANIYNIEGNLVEAKQYLFKSIEIDPFLSKAYSKLSLIYQKEGLLKLALLNTNRSLEIDPKNILFKLRKSKILIELNKYSNARFILADILSKDPNQGVALRLSSIIHVKEGNLNKAELEIKKAIQNDPTSHENYLDLGNIYNLKNDLTNAELYTKYSIKLKKDFPQAYSNLGNIFRSQKKLNKAEFYLKKAIYLQPDYAIAYSNLGNVFLEKGLLNQAEVNFRKSIKLNPNYAKGFSNLGNVLKDLNKLNEAEIMLRKSIFLDPNNEIFYSNLGTVLHAQGKLDLAQLFLENALEINSEFAYAYLNLGTVLRDLGNLEAAKENTLKALNLKPNMSKAYFNLSLLDKYNDSYQNLYSNKIILNKSKEELIDIFFARANFSHKLKDYSSSQKFLNIANKYKSELFPSRVKSIMNKTKFLYKEYKRINAEEFISKDNLEKNLIFIVGMPRSGSSLLESILSRNEKVFCLGETNFFEESYKEYYSQKITNKRSFKEIYFQKFKLNDKKYNFISDKMLSNYQYIGIISKLIPNAKIIHCYRNPLDNILSIYRSNFERGLSFSSSISDTARIYNDHNQIIKKYINICKISVLSQCYEQLVKNPETEIKNLINWMRWDWNEKYLSPHLTKRPILTHSSVQARKKINTRSIDAWKNYNGLLKPAKRILTYSEKVN